MIDWLAATIIGGALLLRKWSIIDPVSFYELEGMALLAILPVGFWAVKTYNNDKR